MTNERRQFQRVTGEFVWLTKDEAEAGGFYFDGGKRESPMQIWEAIKGKAQYYRTARLVDFSAPNISKVDGFVRIIKVACPGTFTVDHPDFGPTDYGCHELTDFGL